MKHRFLRRYIPVISVLIAGIILISNGCAAEQPPTETETIPVNSAPSISSINAPLEVMPSSTSNIICEAVDPDNDDLTYTWTSKDGQISGQGPDIKWTAPAESGSYAIDISVTDGNGGRDTGSVTIAVMEKPNQAPIVVSFLITKADKSQETYIPGETEEPISVQALATAEILANVEDPDGDEYSIRWMCTDGGRLEGAENPVNFIALKKDTNVSVIVTVADSNGAITKTTLPIRIPCCGEGSFGQSGT
jgi:hypothetical protein